MNSFIYFYISISFYSIVEYPNYILLIETFECIMYVYRFKYQP